LDEGLERWSNKIERPNFELNLKEISTKESKTWVIIDFDIYSKEFKTMPDCNKIKNIKIIFFKQGSGQTELNNGCEIQSITHTITLLPNKFQDLNFGTSTSNSFLIMMLYATMNNAKALIKLGKVGCVDIDQSLKEIVHFSSSWKQTKFSPDQYFSAWLPFDGTVAKLWIITVSRFTAGDYLHCELHGSKSIQYNQAELSALEDYLAYWRTDETVNFFHVLDQLNFELAVRGYLSKSDAILYRFWLEHLAKFVRLSVQELQMMTLKEKKV